MIRFHESTSKEFLNIATYFYSLKIFHNIEKKLHRNRRIIDFNAIED